MCYLSNFHLSDERFALFNSRSVHFVNKEIFMIHLKVFDDVVDGVAVLVEVVTTEHETSSAALGKLLHFLLCGLAVLLAVLLVELFLVLTVLAFVHLEIVLLAGGEW